MQVKNIECQIAQAQMRRYLTGEEMPQALVSDLEAHLKNCEECMAAAQSQRESLSGVLSAKILGKSAPSEREAGNGSAIPKRFVKRPEPAPTPSTKPKAKAVTEEKTKAVVKSPLDILDTPDEQFMTKKVKKKANVKTMAYSIGLAVLLVLMSTVFSDPTALFGPKAAESKQDTPPVESDSEGATKNVNEKSTSGSVTPPVTGDDESSHAADTTAGTAADKTTNSTPPDQGVKKPAEDEVHKASEFIDPPVGKNDIIVADTAKGTTVETKPKKKPRSSTIKVYPPDKN